MRSAPANLGAEFYDPTNPLAAPGVRRRTAGAWDALRRGADFIVTAACRTGRPRRQASQGTKGAMDARSTRLLRRRLWTWHLGLGTVRSTCGMYIIYRVLRRILVFALVPRYRG